MFLYLQFQQFLDAKQYSRNGILRYEKIFGRNFVSTGGEDTTKVPSLKFAFLIERIVLPLNLNCNNALFCRSS